jgi:hypothetical protein
MPSRKDKLNKLRLYLDKEAKASAKEMKGHLAGWGIDNGKLSRSIKGRAVKKNNWFQVEYEMADHWDYVESGVKGNTRSSIVRKNVFGKYYKFKKTKPSKDHVKAIEKWGKLKGIPKSASYGIAVVVKRDGLQSKQFYNITLNRRRKNMEKQIENIIFDILNS